MLGSGPIIATFGKSALAIRTGGWGGKNRTAVWRVKAVDLAHPRGLAEPHFIKFHKSLETLQFREPYRNQGVQSFGENRINRRRMDGACDLEIRVPIRNRC